MLLLLLLLLLLRVFKSSRAEELLAPGDDAPYNAERAHRGTWSYTCVYWNEFWGFRPQGSCPEHEDPEEKRTKYKASVTKMQYYSQDCKVTFGNMTTCTLVS